MTSYSSDILTIIKRGENRPSSSPRDRYADILEQHHHPNDDDTFIITKLIELEEIILTANMRTSYKYEGLRKVGQVAALFAVQVMAADLHGYGWVEPGDPLHGKVAGEWCYYEPLSAQCLISLAWPAGQITGTELLRLMLSDHPQRWADQYAEMT